MAKTKGKKDARGRPKRARATHSFNDVHHEESEDQSLPSDETGRLKIKRHYEELLGIRLNKLRGQILNREKINKTIEGIYYICAECKRVCHNLDEGLVREEQTQVNFCSACAKRKGIKGTTPQR